MILDGVVCKENVEPGTCPVFFSQEVMMGLNRFFSLYGDAFIDCLVSISDYVQYLETSSHPVLSADVEVAK